MIKLPSLIVTLFLLTSAAEARTGCGSLFAQWGLPAPDRPQDVYYAVSLLSARQKIIDKDIETLVETLPTQDEVSRVATVRDLLRLTETYRRLSEQKFRLAESSIGRFRGIEHDVFNYYVEEIEKHRAKERVPGAHPAQKFYQELLPKLEAALRESSDSP